MWTIRRIAKRIRVPAADSHAAQAVCTPDPDTRQAVRISTAVIFIAVFTAAVNLLPLAVNLDFFDHRHSP
jgi:hypothetical protein